MLFQDIMSWKSLVKYVVSVCQVTSHSVPESKLVNPFSNHPSHLKISSNTHWHLFNNHETIE